MLVNLTVHTRRNNNTITRLTAGFLVFRFVREQFLQLLLQQSLDFVQIAQRLPSGSIPSGGGSPRSSAAKAGISLGVAVR